MENKINAICTPATMFVREVTREDGTKEPSRTICGRAIVFNSVYEYEDYWGDTYRETIAPEACTKEFIDTQDIKLNLLHKRDTAIGRSNCGKGNLTIRVTKEAVEFELEAPKCDLGDRALELVRSGVYSGCSFEFYPKDYEYQKKEENGKTIYEITHKAFESLTALTIAMDPAYKDTTVDCRERYAPAAPQTPAPASPSAPDVSRESERISQRREIAALRRELEYEINSHNV